MTGCLIPTLAQKCPEEEPVPLRWSETWRTNPEVTSALPVEGQDTHHVVNVPSHLSQA